jgi:hypothetical protein
MTTCENKETKQPTFYRQQFPTKLSSPFVVSGPSIKGNAPPVAARRQNTGKQQQQPSMKRKLILESHQSPGDILMLSAAIRDLQKAYPNRFLIDVRTSAKAVWDNNPYLVDISKMDTGAKFIECHYPLVHRSNQSPYHFIHGYRKFLEDELGLRIPATAFKGDIHLTKREKGNCLLEEKGIEGDFWLIVAGGKYDYTCKFWPPDYYQKVVDHFKGKIQFVQVGKKEHFHPKLKGVIDLVGNTTLRELIVLTHHASGVISPVTFAMHLAAAVETKPGKPKNRAAVIISGGREPVQWEAYPYHRFLAVNGSLNCCDGGGCWRSRCTKVNDKDAKNWRKTCLYPVEIGESKTKYPTDKIKDGLKISKCMYMIKPKDVIRAVETYYEGNMLIYKNSKRTAHYQKSENEIKDAIDVKQLYKFFGLRRTGNHAISYWIFPMLPKEVLYVSNADAFKNPFEYYYFLESSKSIKSDASNVVKIDGEIYRDQLHEYNDFVFVSYEDFDVGNPRIDNVIPYAQSGINPLKETKILVLRDHFNLIASRLKNKVNFIRNSTVKDSARILNMWKNYAREFLKDKSDFLCINYNTWCVSEDYRKEISKTLGLDFCDKGHKYVAPQGGGSSFDKRDFNGKANEMKVFDRWKVVADDSLFKEIVFDEECIELSKKVFGDTMDTDAILKELGYGK